MTAFSHATALSAPLENGAEAVPLMSPRELFQTYAAFVWRTLRYHSVADRDLDDVSQEVFVIVFRKLADFQPTGSQRAWIYGICIRVAKDYRHRAHNRHEILVDQVTDDVLGGAPNLEPERRAQQRQLDAVLQRLDEDKRAVVVLHELEGLPMTEVAELLEVPVKTAYSRLAAARKQMMTMIAKSKLAERM